MSLLRSSRNLIDLAPALAHLQAARLALGQLDAVDALADEVQSLSRRIGHRNAAMFAERHRAFSAWMRTADLDAHETHQRKSIGLIPIFGGNGDHQPYVKLGLTRFWKGEWSTAVESMEKALSLEKDGLFFGSAIGARVLVGAYLGDREVMDLYRKHKPHLPMTGNPAMHSRWEMLVRSVEGLTVLGELDEAAELYPAARDLASRGAALLLWGETLVRKVAGIAAAAGQQWEAAEKHFEIALRHADEIPVRLEQPEVRRWYAWMLRDRDPARAAQLLDEAIEGYEQIRMPRHLQLAKELGRNKTKSSTTARGQ